MAAQDEQHLYSLPYDRVPMESNNYNDLVNKPKINGVTLTGEKSLSDLGIDIPTKTSELTNDSGFITNSDVPTKTSELTNDSDFITETDVDTKLSKYDALDGATIVTNLLDTVQFTSTFDNLATNIQTQLAALKETLNTGESIEIKGLRINTIGNLKPTNMVIINPLTDLLTLTIDWQGFTYYNNAVQAIDILYKKVLTLTMTNDTNDDAYVSYFNDNVAYTFNIEYTKYKTLDLS